MLNSDAKLCACSSEEGVFPLAQQPPRHMRHKATARSTSNPTPGRPIVSGQRSLFRHGRSPCDIPAGRRKRQVFRIVGYEADPGMDRSLNSHPSLGLWSIEPRAMLSRRGATRPKFSPSTMTASPRRGDATELTSLSLEPASRRCEDPSRSSPCHDASAFRCSSAPRIRRRAMSAV